MGRENKYPFHGRKKGKFQLGLSKEDRKALDGLAEELHSSRADVLRIAIHHTQQTLDMMNAIQRSATPQPTTIQRVITPPAKGKP